MEPIETQVSHTDLYHKLGKLEGLMETMMNSVSTFQIAIKDVHSRIDALEQRQNILEQNKSSSNGAISALTTIGKDFLIPVLAITVAWLVARQEITDNSNMRQLQEPLPHEHTQPSN